MDTYFLKIMGTSIIPHDINYSLCLIAIIAMFTLVYIISLMGTKEQTFEEAMAAKNIGTRNNRFFSFSFIVPKTIKNGDTKLRMIKKKGKINSKKISSQFHLPNKKQKNGCNGRDHNEFDVFNDTSNREENLLKSVKANKSVQQNLEPSLNVEYNNLLNDSNILSKDYEANQELNVEKNLNMVKKEISIPLNKMTKSSKNFTLNGTDPIDQNNDLKQNHIEETILGHESSSCIEVSKDLNDNKTNEILVNNHIKLDKRHKKRNKRNKEMLTNINGSPLFDVKNCYYDYHLPKFAQGYKKDGKCIQISAKKNDTIMPLENINTKLLDIGSGLDSITKPASPQQTTGNVCYSTLLLSDGIEERLVSQCTDLPREKMVTVLDKLISTFKIDMRDMKAVKETMDYMQGHVNEVESRLQHSQALIEAANLQIQQLSKDNDQENIKYAKMENSLREKIISMTQELQMHHSRLNEAQGFQNKVIGLQKLLDESSSNHNLAIKTLKEENKRYHENYSQRDTDVKLLEKKLQQLEISFKKDMESKIKAYEDKITYMAKQNERLLNQVKAVEQENTRNKEQLQIFMSEKTHAATKNEELSAKLMEASRELESFKERNKLVNQIEKNAWEMEHKFFGDIRNQLKAIRSDLCIPKEFFNSFLQTMPQKGDQVAMELCNNVTRDMSKTQKVVQIEVEKVGVILGEMSHSMKEFYATLIQRGDKAATIDNSAIFQVLDHAKNDIYHIFNSWEKKFQQSEDRWRLEINDMIGDLRKVVEDQIEVKRDIKIKNKVDPPNLMTTQNETTSYTTNGDYKFSYKSSVDEEKEFEELKRKNNELRQKNWKIMEALKAKESCLAQQLRKPNETIHQNYQIINNERCRMLDLLKTFENKNIDDVLTLESDDFYSSLNEKILLPIIERDAKNDALIASLKSRIEEELNNDYMGVVESGNKFAKQMPSKQEVDNENEALKKKLELLFITFKESLGSLKCHVEENENYIDGLIKLQMESSLDGSGGNVLYPKVSLSKPFMLSQISKTNTQEAQNGKDSNKDKRCQSEFLSHHSLLEPWVEIIIEPLADPSLLRELEVYKMKLQNLQRELVALQCLNEGFATMTNPASTI